MGSRDSSHSEKIVNEKRMWVPTLLAVAGVELEILAVLVVRS